MTAWSEYSDRYGLTPKEAKLFAVLADGEAHSTEQMAIDGIGRRFVAENLVAMHVHRLRKKVAAHGVIIETVRGAGYRVVLPEAAE